MNRKRFILIINVHFQSRKLKFFVSGTLGLEPPLFAWSRPKLAEAGSETSDFRSRPKKWRLRQHWQQELCERLPKVEVALKGAS